MPPEFNGYTSTLSSAIIYLGMMHWFRDDVVLYLFDGVFALLVVLLLLGEELLHLRLLLLCDLPHQLLLLRRRVSLLQITHIYTSLLSTEQGFHFTLPKL